MITIREPKSTNIMQLEQLFQFTRMKIFPARSKDEFQICDYVKSVCEDEFWLAEEN